MEREPDSLEGPESDGRALDARGRLDRTELSAIFAGGFIGALARAALAQSVRASPGTWPWAIFAVNMIGAALLAFIVIRDQESVQPSIHRRAFLAVGFCGTLTTFSTLMLELVKMIEGSYWALASGYCAASIAGGLAAVLLGAKLARLSGGKR